MKKNATVTLVVRQDGKVVKVKRLSYRQLPRTLCFNLGVPKSLADKMQDKIQAGIPLVQGNMTFKPHFKVMLPNSLFRDRVNNHVGKLREQYMKKYPRKLGKYPRGAGLPIYPCLQFINALYIEGYNPKQVAEEWLLFALGGKERTFP